MGQADAEKTKQLSRQNSMDADMQVSSRPNMAFSWNQSNGNEISTINRTNFFLFTTSSKGQLNSE